jgi:hypothetical protein
MNRMLTSVIAAALTFGACREKQAATSQAMRGADTMSGMAGMAQMSMRADSLMPAMRAHLDSLAVAPPFQLAGMMTAHETMTSQVLDAMGADMRAMGMKSDSAWMALRDSVQRDLADLPTLGGALLHGRMRALIDRIRRLLAMHETMMHGEKTR